MLPKIFGCDQMCPLCGIQCDQYHDAEFEDRIHMCEEGHQILGFRGNRQKQDNNAITIGCHDLDDRDIITWKGTEITWEKFKALIYTERRWNLTNKNLVAMQAIKEKNTKIWNKIGPFICEYYRHEQGINIKFQKADSNAKKKASNYRVTYILNLD